MLFLMGVILYKLLCRSQSCRYNCIEGLKEEEDINNKSVRSKYHSKPEYDRLIKQVARRDPIHDAENIYKKNIERGVSQEHPFAPLSTKHLKYFVTYPVPKESSMNSVDELQTKRNIGPFITRSKTYTNDIVHEFGEVRNQGHIGNCWGISIVEIIDSAYYNKTGNIFRTSIQQLMDCLSELDEFNYKDIYLLALRRQFQGDRDAVLLIIQNFYRDSQRKIYSEEEYPSIIEDCDIPTMVAEVAEACVDTDSSGDDCSGFVAGDPASCGDCDYTPPSAAVEELTFCSECNNLYDITINDPSACDSIIESCYPKLGTSGYDDICYAAKTMDDCNNIGIRSGVLTGVCEWSGLSCETDLCDDCDRKGWCNKQCKFCSDNICNDNNNETCNTFKDSNGNTCTNDINNRCIQSCRTDINTSENITVKDVIFLDNINDQNIYNNLLNNTLVCYINATDEMMHFDSTNCYIIFSEDSDTDENLFWNPDTIENDSSYIYDSNIYDLNNVTCSSYRNWGWCCSLEDEGGYACNDKYFGIDEPFCRKLDEIDGENVLIRDLIITNQNECANGDGEWISNTDDSVVLPTWKKKNEFCKETCARKPYIINHVVVIVGCIYKDNESLPEEKRSISSNGRYFWKIRNSWGNEWGDNGYFYIERDVNDERFNGNASLLSINHSILYVELDIN